LGGKYTSDKPVDKDEGGSDGDASEAIRTTTRKGIHLKEKEKLLVLRAVGVAPLPTRCDELAGAEGGGRQEGGGGKVASKLHYKFIVACVPLSSHELAIWEGFPNHCVRFKLLII
jgi:hypothetical protein